MKNDTRLRKRHGKMASHIGSILSKIHQATVHVFSDSVSCVGTHAMSDATSNFTKRWKDHPRHGGTTSSKGIISKFLDCEFHVMPGVTVMKLIEGIQQNISSTSEHFLDERLHRKRLYSRDALLQHHLHGRDEPTNRTSGAPKLS